MKFVYGWPQNDEKDVVYGWPLIHTREKKKKSARKRTPKKEDNTINAKINLDEIKEFVGEEEENVNFDDSPFDINFDDIKVVKDDD